MTMFFIKRGTKCKTIRDHAEWYHGNFTEYYTEEDMVFGKEQVTIDPVGKLGIHHGMPHSVGGLYANAGYYGFNKEGTTFIIHAEHVECW